MTEQEYRDLSDLRLYGMASLRGMFPDAKADDLNFVLFSTSGVHGTYNTIEDAERFLKGEDAEGHSKVTFVIVHPRLVVMRYGVCDPMNQDDIDYLKQLRASSQEAVAGIGTRLDGVKQAHVIFWPAQCKCGHIFLEKYQFSELTKEGNIGFCWCGFCQTKRMVKPSNV